MCLWLSERLHCLDGWYDEGFVLRPAPILITLFLLASCDTLTDELFGSVDDRIFGWIGRDADELVRQLGAPDGEYSSQAVTVMRYDRPVPERVVGDAPAFSEDECKMNFFLDAGNRIDDIKWNDDYACFFASDFFNPPPIAESSIEN